MKVLIIGDLRIIFTYEYITQILYRMPDVEVDVLNFNYPTHLSLERSKEIIKHGGKVFFQPQYRIVRSFRFLWPLIRIREAYRYRIVKKYDLIHIHYVGSDSWVVPRYLNSMQRLVVSIYGSDLLQTGKKMNPVFRNLFQRANAITVATKIVEKKLSDRFSGKYDKKVIRARYGSLAAEVIGKCVRSYTREESKQAFKLPINKKVILCGYNASPIQRHQEIVSVLSKMSQSVKDQIYLLFHCSYGGSPDYIDKIRSALIESKIDGKIVVDFLQGEQLAIFRKSVDIFLNLQYTDVLSASMIEELEAGAIVIKGDWLSYPDLEKKGVWLCSIPEMASLAEQISIILNDFDTVSNKASQNIGVTDLLTWEKEFPHWSLAVLGNLESEIKNE